MTFDPWRLGATLYLPATHKDLAAVFRGERLAQARSIVVCFEDAILAEETEAGIANLIQALAGAVPGAQMRFVRPRNAALLERLLALPHSEALAGAVLPKVTVESWDGYRQALDQREDFSLMPTLETAEVFDGGHLRELRRRLLEEQHRVPVLRIGGNDLLHQLGMRRPRHHTLYDTPLKASICRLVQVFKPYGFSLSAPVFEYVDRMDLLEREVAEDLRHGLTCKTAIHPAQIPVIEAGYKVSLQDMEAARAILDPAAPAVFRLHGAMCEPATHRRWAEQIILRHELYGQTPL